MKWNWQQPNWPHFEWDQNKLYKAERLFTEGAGIIIGASQHLTLQSNQNVLIDLMCTEALYSSEIEGEFLNRESVRSSIQKELGLSTDNLKGNLAEQGIAKLMVNLYQTIPETLSHQILFDWHRMLLSYNPKIENIGLYRTHDESMQIVSGPDYHRKIHFEAPPSKSVIKEMEQFLNWFELTKPEGPDPLPSLTRSGIAHLWFESIHPFEDGNKADRGSRLAFCSFYFESKSFLSFPTDDFNIKLIESCLLPVLPAKARFDTISSN